MGRIKITVNLDERVLEFPEDVLFLDESLISAGVLDIRDLELQKALYLRYETSDEDVVYEELSKIEFILRKRGLLERIEAGDSFPEGKYSGVFLAGDFDVDVYGGSG